MIFFWYGENEYAITEQLRHLKAKYIEKTGSDTDMQTFDMANHEVSDLLAVLSTMPMFVSSRLIIVRDLGGKKPDKDICDEIINLTSESTNLVLIEPKPDKRGVFFKTFSLEKGVKMFKNISHAELRSWMQKKAQQLGVDITPADISYLVERVGNDQWRLSNELQKLQGIDQKITRSILDEQVIPSVEYSSFALVDCLVQKNLVRTLKLYNNLKIQGEADQMILGAIMYQYRVFLAILAGGEAPSAMSISPYALQKSRNTAQKLHLEELKVSFNLLANTDIAIKTGQLSSEEAMKQLFEHLCR